ncbi:hypothetical protein DPMN_034345, partial [Dreissena polymorpha]
HIQNIIKRNILTKFHEDFTINPCFPTNWNNFELVQDIIGAILVTKFHEYQTINVASRVLTRKQEIWCKPTNRPTNQQTNRQGKNNMSPTTIGALKAPPLGSHVFQAKVTIFELIQDIIETNLLFYKSLTCEQNGVGGVGVVVICEMM